MAVAGRRLSGTREKLPCRLINDFIYVYKSILSHQMSWLRYLQRRGCHLA
jgi:hypothetical protein